MNNPSGPFDDLIPQAPAGGGFDDLVPASAFDDLVPAAKSQTKVGGSGTATVFGLNPDGSIDHADNGQGYYGYNTRNPNLVGVSLPPGVLKSTFGTLDAARGTRVQVTNPATGRQIEAPLVDVGPSDHLGRALDLTYGAMRQLGGTGNDQMQYRIIIPSVPSDQTTPPTQ